MRGMEGNFFWRHLGEGSREEKEDKMIGPTMGDRGIWRSVHSHVIPHHMKNSTS